MHDPNEASTSPPGVISQARVAAEAPASPRTQASPAGGRGGTECPPRLRGLGPQCRSISQHVGLSSHLYQQLLLLYKIGSSIDRGQAKFAPVALGHARHGYIYLCRESWLAGGGARVRAAGVAHACGVLWGRKVNKCVPILCHIRKCLFSARRRRRKLWSI